MSFFMIFIHTMTSFLESLAKQYCVLVIRFASGEMRTTFVPLYVSTSSLWTRPFAPEPETS